MYLQKLPVYLINVVLHMILYFAFTMRPLRKHFRYSNKVTGYKSLGGKKTIINVDTLCANFESGDTVTIEKLYEKKLVTRKYGQIKVLARGVLTKSLMVVAEDFSADAIKMIVLMNGEVLTRK